MHLSKHASARLQQRAISPLIVDWLVTYGTRVHDKHGATKVFFDRRARKRLSRVVGKQIVEQLRKQLNTFLVTAGEEIITAGHSTKRIQRH